MTSIDRPWRLRRRSLIPCLALLLLPGCGNSATDVEQPPLRTGASHELAIELPPFFPPPPRRATVVTEFSVISSGAIWFRNTTEDPIDLKMVVTDDPKDIVAKVGIIRLGGFQTGSMRLDPTYTTTEFRGSDWTLEFRQDGVFETITMAIG